MSPSVCKHAISGRVSSGIWTIPEVRSRKWSTACTRCSFCLRSAQILKFTISSHQVFLDSVKISMKHKTTMYAMAPPFPSLAGALASHPAKVSLHSAAELAYACPSGIRSNSPRRACARAPFPPTISRGPRGFRNASLRKDGAMACDLLSSITGIPAGRTFPESRLRARLGTHSTRANGPKGQAALFECAARVRSLSEAPSRKWVTARSRSREGNSVPAGSLVYSGRIVHCWLPLP